MKYEEVHVKYTPLVLRLVRRYPSLYWEDLQQEAYIALYQAMNAWKSNRASFMTLAYRYIHTACYRYMRDRAYLVRVPAKVFSSGEQVECMSLDELLQDAPSLEEFFGAESKEEIAELSEAIWTKLKDLANRDIIKWHDFCFIYFRYFQGWKYEELGKYFGCSVQVAQRRVSKIIQRIRPYFLGRRA